MNRIFPTKYRIISHILFWICVFSLFIFTAILRGNNIQAAIVLNLALLPLDMTGAYFTIYFLIPKYLFKKKYHIFFPALLVFILVYGILVVTPAEYYIITMYSGADKWGSPWVFMPIRLLWTLVILLMIIGLASSVKITKHWLLSQKNAQELLREKILTELKLREAELKFLKSQIHPHFLFNTLNNLYGLTLAKSDLAPEVVMKLSGMLDYMLYECNQKLVPISNELNLIRNYIGLEQIRHDDFLTIRIDFEEVTGHYKIAPLLLLAFVENAFKHGGEDREDKKYIAAKLKIKQDKLFYEVENSIQNASSADQKEEIQEHIGLQNLRKRLEIQYKDKFELIFSREPNTFKASLTLDLHSEENSL